MEQRQRKSSNNSSIYSNQTLSAANDSVRSEKHLLGKKPYDKKKSLNQLILMAKRLTNQSFAVQSQKSSGNLQLPVQEELKDDQSSGANSSKTQSSLKKIQTPKFKLLNAKHPDSYVSSGILELSDASSSSQSKFSKQSRQSKYSITKLNLPVPN